MIAAQRGADESVAASELFRFCGLVSLVRRGVFPLKRHSGEVRKFQIVPKRLGTDDPSVHPANHYAQGIP